MPPFRTASNLIATKEEAYKRYSALIKKCQGLRTGCAWEDPDFPPDLRMLFQNASQPWRGHLEPISAIEWLRPHMMDNVTNPQLFCDGTEAGDVIQGALGDCWFMGALSVLAANDKLESKGARASNKISNRLRNLFINEQHIKDGLQYGVWLITFFKEDTWKYVIIDDLFPCVYGRPIYGHSKDANELWVMLLEKAYAKVHGSYEALQSGFVDYGLRDLTGGAPIQIKIEPRHKNQNQKQQLWADMQRYYNEGAIMGCSYSAKGQTEVEFQYGILRGHAYGILKMDTISASHRSNNQRKTFNLIRIRNPWGKREWKGPWSDNDDMWENYPEAKTYVTDFGYTFDSNDGTFYMECTDFVEYFNTIFVLRLLGDQTGAKRGDGQWTGNKLAGDWKVNDGTSGGCPRFDTWWQNPQFPIKVRRKTEVVVLLTQADMRIVRGQTWNNYGSRNIGFILLKAPVESQSGQFKRITKMRKTDLVANSVFKPQREVSHAVFLERGDYVVVPMLFDQGVPGTFECKLYSDQVIDTDGMGSSFDPTSDLDTDSETEDQFALDADTGVQSAAPGMGGSDPLPVSGAGVPGIDLPNWDTQKDCEEDWDSEQINAQSENPSVQYHQLFSQMYSTIKNLEAKVNTLTERVAFLDGKPNDVAASADSMRLSGIGGSKRGDDVRASAKLGPDPQSIYERKCKEFGVKPNSKLRIPVGAESYDFSANYFGPKGILPVIEALRCNPNFHTLNVSGVGLEDVGTLALVSLLKDHPKLVSLDISNNAIEDAGSQALMELARSNGNIVHLDISNNDDIDRGIVRDINRTLDRNSAHMRALKEAANIFLTHNDPTVLLSLAENFNK